MQSRGGAELDILLDTTGDLYISPSGDIEIKESVAQKIKIKLLWFEGEWKWNVEEGMPYKDRLLIKNPEIDYFEGVIRQKIFEIEEITEVKDVNIEFDTHTRSAVIKYIALTDYETINEEVVIRCRITE